MSTRRIMAPATREVTHETARNLAARDPRKRDHILTVVGWSRSATGLKASRQAALMGHSEGHESRVRNGLRSTKTSRAAEAIYEAAEEEAAGLERAGQAAAHVEAILKAIAMWPELEKLTTEELHAELRRTIRQKETRANGLCNNLEADYLDEGRLDLRAMHEAYERQAAASERVMAILELLALREQAN